MKFPVYVFTNMLPFGYRTAHLLLGGRGVAGAETVPFLRSSILCLLINTTVTTLKSSINGIRAGPRIRLSSEIRPSSFLTGANSLTQWFGCGFLLSPEAVGSRLSEHSAETWSTAEGFGYRPCERSSTCFSCRRRSPEGELLAEGGQVAEMDQLPGATPRFYEQGP